MEIVETFQHVWGNKRDNVSNVAKGQRPAWSGNKWDIVSNVAKGQRPTWSGNKWDSVSTAAKGQRPAWSGNKWDSVSNVTQGQLALSPFRGDVGSRSFFLTHLSQLGKSSAQLGSCLVALMVPTLRRQ